MDALIGLEISVIEIIAVFTICFAANVIKKNKDDNDKGGAI